MKVKVQTDLLDEEYESVSLLVKKHPQTRSPEEIAVIVSFLKRLDLFKGMSQELIIPVAEHLKVYELDAKTVICKEGDIGTIFYVLIKGQIKVFKQGILISTM